MCCRRGVTADAIGWLKLGPMDAGGTGEGECTNEHTQTNTTIYPGSGPSCGGKTPTPACLIYMKDVIQATMELLELYGERWKTKLLLSVFLSVWDENDRTASPFSGGPAPPYIVGAGYKVNSGITGKAVSSGSLSRGAWPRSRRYRSWSPRLRCWETR